MRQPHKLKFVAYALVRAASTFVSMPGGEPPELRVYAGRPQEWGRGTHECARHSLIATVRGRRRSA
jgi:hypothetical protein